MNYEEAKEWLKGKRSMCNSIPNDPDGYDMTTEVRVAKADAAMMQQAYYVAKAHKEGLVKL